MPVHRLNHAVLYVRDARRTADFYEQMLGFKVVSEMPRAGALFLRAPASTNDHDLGLFTIGHSAGPSVAGSATVGLYHLAWEVDTLDELGEISDRLSEAGALVGATDHSTTKSLYARDPDGIEMEIVWLVPAELLTEEAHAGRVELKPLDLEEERARYGGQTLGGVGVSR